MIVGIQQYHKSFEENHHTNKMINGKNDLKLREKHFQSQPDDVLPKTSVNKTYDMVCHFGF